MNDISGQTGDPTVHSRRAVIAGLGAVLGLAACGGGNETASRRPAESGGTPSDEPIQTNAIPVGGGVVLVARDVVITQPTQGDFKAFEATCTHQGCFVNSVTDGSINCGCHGSKFSIVDGSVTVPAPGMTRQTQSPLPSKSITVSGDVITIA